MTLTSGNFKLVVECEKNMSELEAGPGGTSDTLRAPYIYNPLELDGSGLCGCSASENLPTQRVLKFDRSAKISDLDNQKRGHGTVIN